MRTPALLAPASDHTNTWSAYEFHATEERSNMLKIGVILGEYPGHARLGTNLPTGL